MLSKAAADADPDRGCRERTTSPAGLRFRAG